MGYRIGIDAGSKTIKVVVVDESDKIVYSIYRRHRFDIKTTVAEAVHDLVWRYGDIEGTIGITGSAGIGLADVLGLPFVQEVVATTRAVQRTYPEADAIIELGGEDAKIVYLTGRLEQRMNATCAGGTGGFIDTIAFRIGARSKDMSNLSLRAGHVYPIASRCAVFAETDVRPLLNAGASASDIAASALEAVVRQTIGGLACGRPITGTVVFLGGPLEYIPDLVRRFRTALGLTSRTGIKPPDAHLFAALGAAIACGEGKDAARVSLAALENEVKAAPNPKNDLPRLEPLFENDVQAEAFRKRHVGACVPRANLFDVRGPLYLGIDAGSTAVKLALVNSDNALVYSDYRPTKGDALATTLEMLEQLYVDLPRTYGGEALAYIAHATATGYGENILRAALGVDSGVVETTAHTAAALRFEPDLTFLLDIGGQDIKAIWVRDGMIEEAVLNEACSSGCGSFIEGTAYSLRSTPERFAEAALSAAAPVDLGTKCTVFMTSRIRHAQKAGTSVADLAAGAAYSVVRNALFRIIGVENLASLGDKIVVQGGAFMSDAVLRAFEKVAGVEVTRPVQARLMGALGAAYVAHERAARLEREAGEPAKSTLIARDAIASFSPRRRTMRCPGCANSCELSVITFGNGSSFISGNRCDRAEGHVGLSSDDRVSTAIGLARDVATSERRVAPPNAIALEQRLLARYASCDGDGHRGDVYVGLVNTLRTYATLPFWHTLIRTLGFSVLVAPSLREAQSEKELTEGLDTIPSESVCYPAKISHVRAHALVRLGADAVLAPQFERGTRCPVSCEYANALHDSSPVFEKRAVTFCSPVLRFDDPERIASHLSDRDALFEALADLAPDVAPLGREEFDAALGRAVLAQRSFEEALARGNERALSWARESGRHAIVVAGRPYHADPDVLHAIDEVLIGLGFSVVAGEALRLPKAKAPGEAPWKPSRHITALARFVLDHPEADLVYLTSFGCEYDAMSIPDARMLLRKAGRPLTALKIDDIADTAHLRIRLRTLAETIERIGDRAGVSDAGPFDAPAAVDLFSAEEPPRGAVLADACAPEAARAVVPATDAMIEAARAGSLRAFDRLDANDVATARMHVNDVCFVASALAGRAIRIVSSAPDVERLVVPLSCTDCLVDGIGRIVERALGHVPVIEYASPDIPPAFEQSAVSVDGFSDGESESASLGATRPLVGLVGASPLVFDAYLNDDLAEFIRKNGCDVVFPDPKLLAVEDVRYLDQLDRFQRMGVKHVIYLLSFGCLKGHVRARGAARALERRYPDMPVTIIDYDPEASALNRENRVRLALESLLG